MAGRAKSPEERAEKLARAVEEGRSAGPRTVEPGQPGNDLAVTHGAFSPAIVNPRGQAKLDEWLADENFLAHAKELYWRSTLRDLAWTEARVELVQEMCDEAGVDSYAELAETVEDEDFTGNREGAGSKHRVSRTVKRMPPAEEVRRWMVHALNLRKEMGLTPMSYARLGLDVKRTQSLTELWESR